MSESLDEYLSHHERSFTAACELILRNPVPAGIAYGFFWLQIDNTKWDHLPISLVWCDHDHGCDVQYPSPLTSIPSANWSPPKGLDDSAIGEHIFRWISCCWNNAGGMASSVPFYGYNYHTSEQFCLRRARYVTDEEITTEL
ncbi:MAG: hypothetical protein EOP84_31005, partial [Verrucomicrobiaceae bacterium]